MIIALQTLIFFRQSLLATIDRLVRPYYERLSLTFGRHSSESEDEDSEEQVFAEYDEEKGVVFIPPMYAQRYAAVTDCLIDERWNGKLEKIVDLGYHDMNYIRYLKDIPGVKFILGVDIESIPLRCSSGLFASDDFLPKRDNPLRVSLYQGNAADPDYRLIGTDAVVAIEMIEHMLPHDLDRLIHTIFGFIKPRIAVITTPNADFNVLFKSLEKNGWRRWDHLFEWTRAQFHDWCSNIVVRYPQYTVTCRGVGPGPPDTSHLGCCSQLALFIAKDYHKQEDLNLESLTLVENPPDPSRLVDITDSWDTVATRTTVDTPLCSVTSSKSVAEFIFDKRSCMNIVLSPKYSLNLFQAKDKTFQCNIDKEREKSYLMFDQESPGSVLVPRRKQFNRVYHIEDVTSRLNSTTFRVEKFSKPTQNLMAKNNIESLVHTKEVVDEIRHLTKMLNFNKDGQGVANGCHVWNNINWGDNAPYWNQYYEVVREYVYPFEIKSDDSQILELISDEINRVVDKSDNENIYVNKLEIPLVHLMSAVKHITDDVERIKELLEWNGYEVEDYVLIHSRLVVGSATMSEISREDTSEAMSDVITMRSLD